MRHEHWTCDVDDCPSPDFNVQKNKKLQVIFHTDQTEGRPRTPYLTRETLDICAACLDMIIQGEALHGSGAQGHNRYWFKKKIVIENT